jgi:hypothetical protein
MDIHFLRETRTMNATERTGTLAIPRGTLPSEPHHNYDHVEVADEGDGVYTFYNRNLGKRVSVPADLRSQILWNA